MNTCMTSLTGIPLFTINIRFSSLKITKVLFTTCHRLSVKVWSFRLNGCYPHNMWTERHFLFFLQHLIILIIHPIIQLQTDYWIPHFFCNFLYFISQLFHSFAFAFFFSFFLSFFYLEGLYIFQDHCSKGNFLHFLIFLHFSPCHKMRLFFY